jgi:hypothetical protein
MIDRIIKNIYQLNKDTDIRNMFGRLTTPNEFFMTRYKSGWTPSATSLPHSNPLLAVIAGALQLIRKVSLGNGVKEILTIKMFKMSQFKVEMKDPLKDNAFE